MPPNTDGLRLIVNEVEQVATTLRRAPASTAVAVLHVARGQGCTACLPSLFVCTTHSTDLCQRQVQLLRAATIGDAGAALHQGRGLLVHCSGGVGRTGVFLAAYHTIVSALPRNAGA